MEGNSLKEWFRRQETGNHNFRKTGQKRENPKMAPKPENGERNAEKFCTINKSANHTRACVLVTL